MNPTVAYIFIRYPVLSQRFLQREIDALRAQGVNVEIHSFHDVAWHEWFNVPCELARKPSLVRDGLRWLRACPPNNAENFWSTVWAALFALARARRIRASKPDVLHGAWATAPATAAAILGRLCNIPFSFGAHAYDIYRHGGDAFLQPKLRSAAFVHTTTETNVAHLRQRAAGSSANIVLARRGLEQLPEISEQQREPGPIRILSVGRLVAKKGHEHQLAACSALKKDGIPFQLQIVGEGPLRPALQARIDAVGLDDCVTLCGALEPAEVDQAYRWADIFWHTGIVDEEGDRDGLPNVIPEAFAHCLPVISSETPGATEAVTNEMTGLVVDVSNPAELAAAVKRLVADPELRQRLGGNGRRWVKENFQIANNAAILARAFAEVAGSVRPSSTLPRPSSSRP